ncbi:jg20780, partial [Pararge aegeria aegeria]
VSPQADDRRLIRLVRERRLLYARNNMPVASYYTQVKNLWDDVARSMGWSVADVRRKWSHIRNSYSRHLRNEMHGTCTSRGRMVSRWYLADELEFLREHMATDILANKTTKRELDDTSQGLDVKKHRQHRSACYASPFFSLMVTQRVNVVATGGWCACRRPTSFSSFSPTMVDMELPDSAPESVDVKPFLQSPWFQMGARADAGPPPSALNDDSCSSAFGPEETSSYFQFFRGIYNDYQELPARKQRLFKRNCLNMLHDLLDAEEGSHISIVNAYHQESVLNLSNSGHGSEDDRDKKPNIDECYILPNST